MSTYQTAGPIGDRHLYLKRPSDETIISQLRQGSFCALLAPKQQGKTSLMLRAARELRSADIRCIFIDIGLTSPTSASTETVLAFIRNEISLALNIDSSVIHKLAPDEFRTWFATIADASERPLAIFIDEIHQLLEVPSLAEDLLQLLRVLHELRSTVNSLRCVSYCLAGATRPGDLVKDKTRNPLLTGKIKLDDFTLAELDPIRSDFEALGIDPRLVEHIYRWTSGQPAMTLRLASAVASSGEGCTPGDVDEIVSHEFFSEDRPDESIAQEALLLFRTTRRFGDADLDASISLYRRVLDGARVRLDEEGAEGSVLILTGLVASRGGEEVLELRNRITQRQFDIDWLNRMEVYQRIETPTRKWLEGGRSPTLLLRDLPPSTIRLAKEARDISREQREFIFECLESGSAVGLPTLDLESILKHLESRDRELASKDGEIHNRIEERYAALVQRRRYLVFLLLLAMVALVSGLFVAVWAISHARSKDDEFAEEVQRVSQQTEALKKQISINSAHTEQLVAAGRKTVSLAAALSTLSLDALKKDATTTAAQLRTAAAPARAELQLRSDLLAAFIGVRSERNSKEDAARRTLAQQYINAFNGCESSLMGSLLADSVIFFNIRLSHREALAKMRLSPDHCKRRSRLMDVAYDALSDEIRIVDVKQEIGPNNEYVEECYCERLRTRLDPGDGELKIESITGNESNCTAKDACLGQSAFALATAAYRRLVRGFNHCSKNDYFDGFAVNLECSYDTPNTRAGLVRDAPRAKLLDACAEATPAGSIPNNAFELPWDGRLVEVPPPHSTAKRVAFLVCRPDKRPGFPRLIVMEEQLGMWMVVGEGANSGRMNVCYEGKSYRPNWELCKTMSDGVGSVPLGVQPEAAISQHSPSKP